MKYHDVVKDDLGGRCWCSACLHPDCTDPAASNAEVAGEMVAWEIAGKPDFWRLTDGPCPN